MKSKLPHLHKRILLLLPTLLFCLACSVSYSQDRPNILFILVDDMGYGDIEVFRGEAPWTNLAQVPDDVDPPKTPNLDALAESGVMLTDFYANCSVCSPTRAAVMTGKYQHRTGVVSVLGQLGSAMRQVSEPGEEVFTGLSPDEVTIADILLEAGYRTALFGKWHLGPFSRHHPMDFGFEVYVGSPNWAGNNFSMKSLDGTSYFYRGRQTVDAPGYWYTDVLTDESIAYMTDDADDRPFFVYLSHTAPHDPYFGPNDKEISKEWDEHGPDRRFGPRKDLHQAYKEIIEGLDASIGRLVSALEEAGMLDNTIIFFTSDNGPTDYGSAEPLRGRKTWLYEGGTRVPTFATWPSAIPAGSKSDFPSMTMDLLPTFAYLAGASIPSDMTIDGINLTPVLLGEEEPEDRMLFWEKPIGVFISQFTNRRWAVRNGKWKLQQERSGKELELYDLDADPKEMINLADQNPEIVERLKEEFQRWRKEVYADSPYDEDKFIERLIEQGLLQQDGLL